MKNDTLNETKPFILHSVYTTMKSDRPKNIQNKMCNKIPNEKNDIYLLSSGLISAGVL